MTTQQDLTNRARAVAKAMTREGATITSYTSTDDVSVKGWEVCSLSIRDKQRRRIVILSEQGELHLLTEDLSTTTIEPIRPAIATKMTGQSLVSLFMQIDRLADIQP